MSGRNALAVALRTVAPERLVPSANFDYAMRTRFFPGVELANKAVLDIGCGDGRMALWAAAHGARRVVGLEPEVEGSSAGMQAAFQRGVEQAGFEDRVELVRGRVQEYAGSGERFDIILMAASINHLDEDACIRLHEDEGAREVYRQHFRRLADLAAPGAVLVAADCARRNLFGGLGARNPMSPGIEWHKHQSPRLWAALLADAGFVAPRIRWLAFNTLRTPGQLLLGNRVCAFLTTSSFCLTVRYPGAATRGSPR